jgi:hypothetical protein
MIAHYSGKVKCEPGTKVFDELSEESMTEGTGARDRRRFGRPPKPRDEVRSERVVSFVTRDEYGALVELAATRGQSVSAAIHHILSTRLMEETKWPPR